LVLSLSPPSFPILQGFCPLESVAHISNGQNPLNNLCMWGIKAPTDHLTQVLPECGLPLATLLILIQALGRNPKQGEGDKTPFTDHNSKKYMRGERFHLMKLK